MNDLESSFDKLTEVGAGRAVAAAVLGQNESDQRMSRFRELLASNNYAEAQIFADQWAEEGCTIYGILLKKEIDARQQIDRP